MVESTSNLKISFLNLLLVSVTAWVSLTPEIRQSIPVTHSSVCLLDLRKIPSALPHILCGFLRG